MTEDLRDQFNFVGRIKEVRMKEEKLMRKVGAREHIEKRGVKRIARPALLNERRQRVDVALECNIQTAIEREHRRDARFSVAVNNALAGRFDLKTSGGV